MRVPLSLPAGLLVLACAWPLLLLPRQAAAQTRGGWQVTFDDNLRWIPHLPGLQMQQPVLADERAIATRLPSAGASTMLDVNLGLACTVNDRWVFPLGGAGVGLAVGPHPRVWAYDGDVPVAMKPWTTASVAVLLPGAGVRMKHRRWMFQFALVPAVRFWFMDVTAGSDQSVKATAAAATFAMTAQTSICRRLDPVRRACLLFTPVIYEGQFANGGSVGLRWELGP